MKKKTFRGTSTALITPFRDGKIDYSAFERIIDAQLSHGIKTLVVGGTTGESATLTERERQELYEFSRAKTLGRAALILGTGTNDTEDVIKRTRLAQKTGADAALVVTPYYNKGTVSGVTEHYLKVANCSDLPIIVYNVPSRTGVNLTLSQLEAFAKSEKIIGVKEATDSIDRFVKIASIGEDLPLYSGNDNSIFTALCLGGVGVISVISNAFPLQTDFVYGAFSRGDIAASREMQIALLPMIDAVFCETNPTPIKYAMSSLGYCTPEVRLPLSPPTEESKRLITLELSRRIPFER